MNIINSIKILSLVIVLFLSAGLLSNAQVPSLSSSISIESIPRTPGSFERVVLKLSSFSVDLDRSTISWSINGELIKNGIGEKTFSFITGGLGEMSKVSVSISSGVLGSVTQSISFTPTEIDLLWEAVDVYVPPFYKGKALPPSQSLIKIVALPHLKTSGNKEISSKSLTYKWKKNDKYRDFNNQSGYGKNSVIFRKDLVRQSELVEVEVLSSGGLRGYNNILIGQYDTDIIFYEQNPLEGIVYEKAIDNEFRMESNEVTIIAEPYFFSVASRENSNLSFEWRLNKQLIDPGLEKSAVTFRTDGESGVSEISLAVKNLLRFLQFTEGTFNINFEN